MTTTAPDGLPAVIPFADIEAVLAAIGVNAADCISLTFGIDGVTIERVRRDINGKDLVMGNSIATVTTTIGYDRDAGAR